MAEKEQNLRNQYIQATDIAAKESLKSTILKIDELHLMRLKEVIRDYGWPGYSLIGSEGTHAFWLLVQHAPDHLFQKQCLELLEQAVAHQEASSIDLAYLKDRVCVSLGEKQIYGTQCNENLTLYPIEDEEHVNERRQNIGLPSIEDYLDMLREEYHSH